MESREGVAVFTRAHERIRSRRQSVVLLTAVVMGLIPSTIVLTHPTTALAASAYKTAVLANSPSVYYRLGESSGTSATDSSGNGDTGTYQSGVMYGVTGAIVGDSDTAVSTSSGPVVLGSDSSLPTGSSTRTLEAWENTASTSDQGLVAYGTSAAPWRLGIRSGDQIHLYDITDDISVTTPYSIEDGNWHQVAVSLSASTSLTFFLDGQEVGTGTLSAAPSTVAAGSSGLAIGNGFNGSLDEPAVYGSALTAAQINAHWRAANNSIPCGSTPTDPYGAAVAAASPSRFYRYAESSGSAVEDSSGNCYVAALAGSATRGFGPTLSSSDKDVSLTGSGPIGFASDVGLPSGNTARTLEGWEKTTNGNDPGLLGYGLVSGTSPTVFRLGLEDDTHLEFFDGANTVDTAVPTGIQLADGNWHQLAETWDGTTLTMYVDGQQAGTSSLGTAPNTTVPGAGLLFGNQLTGSVAEEAVYPTALSAMQIRTHYLTAANTSSLNGGSLTAAENPDGFNGCIVCWVSHLLTGSATPTPINTESGNFFHTFSDISIPGRSYPLAIERTYNSQNASTNSPFGYGWTYNYGMSLATSGTSPNEVATITQEDGSQATFNQPASGNSWAPSAPRFIATLTYNPGSSTWTFVRQGRDTYTFNSSGQVTQATDLNGYNTTFSYTSGNLTTITDPASRTLTFTWTGSNITKVTDSNVSGNTRTVQYGYDGSGNLTSVTDLNGGITDFAYDGSHRMTLMRMPNFHSNGALGTAPSSCTSTPVSDAVNNHYNSSGQVDCQWDQNGNKTTFTYSGTPQTTAGGTTVITDPSGNETEDGYQYGVRTFTTSGYGTSAAATTSFTYDPNTLALIGMMDPNGNVTTYTVDSSGNILTRTDPLGRVTTNTYNSLNEVLTTEDGNSVTTTNAYDSHGNLTSTSTPLTSTSATATNCLSPTTAVAMAQVTCYTYGNSSFPGDVTQITDPDGNSTSFGYDSNGYQDQVKDPLSNVTDTVRNNDGWITASYSPRAACTWGSAPPTGCSSTYETQYSYTITGGSATDEFGDVGTITDPNAHATKYTYDLDRNTTVVKDGNGNSTTNAYDAADRLCWTLPGGTSSNTCSSPPTNARVTDYNANNTVADQKDGLGNKIISYGYNSRNQVTSTTDELGNVTTYVLDSNGNVLNKIDPGGSCTGTVSKCTTNTYDADDELKTVSYSDSSSENVTSTTYDSDGQRTAMTDGTGSSSWSYDSLHRLTAYTNGNGATVSYGFTYGAGPTYDLRNQPRTIVYPNSVGTVSQTWNAGGQLTTIKDWNSKSISVQYSADSLVNKLTYPSTTNVVDTLGYNASDYMTSISDVAGATTLFSATYGRDSDQQVNSDTSQATNQQKYKYTALSQLCYAGSANTTACSSPPTGAYPYAYSNADNLTNNNGVTQQYNGADELCWTLSGTSGNNCATVPTGATTYGYDTRGNLTSSVPATGSATCDTYDQANRLTQIQTGTGSSCTSPTTVGTYAYDGDSLRESKTVSGTTTQFVWDGTGSHVLQQNNGTTKTSFILGPNGLPLEQIAGSTTTYLHEDQIGSVRLITDSAGSTSTASTTTYSPYGTVVSTSGSLTSPFGFAGMYLDNESGLYAATHRYYSPTPATWLSADPLVSTTRQPYQYVNANPLNGHDRQGLGWCGEPDVSQGCSTLPPGYPGVSHDCFVIGNGSTDVVTVEASVSCTAFNTPPKEHGPSYIAEDPAAEGSQPANQTCSSDPGTGYSHCTTAPSEIFDKCFVTAALFVPDVILFALDAPAGASLTWVATETGIDTYDWTH